MIHGGISSFVSDVKPNGGVKWSRKPMDLGCQSTGISVADLVYSAAKSSKACLRRRLTFAILSVDVRLSCKCAPSALRA